MPSRPTAKVTSTSAKTSTAGASSGSCTREWARLPARLFRLPNRSVSLSDHVLLVLVVLFADALDEIGIRYQAPSQIDGPWLRVRLRIINRDFDIHVPDLRAGETFDDAQRFGPRQSSHVEPGFCRFVRQSRRRTCPCPSGRSNNPSRLAV